MCGATICISRTCDVTVAPGIGALCIRCSKFVCKTWIRVVIVLVFVGGVILVTGWFFIVDWKSLILICINNAIVWCAILIARAKWHTDNYQKKQGDNFFHWFYLLKLMSARIAFVFAHNFVCRKCAPHRKGHRFACTADNGTVCAAAFRTMNFCVNRVAAVGTVFSVTGNRITTLGTFNDCHFFTLLKIFNSVLELFIL